MADPKSMANQEKSENSGLSSGRPSFRLPNRPIIRTTQLITSTKAVIRYSQPQLPVVQANTALITVFMFSGKRIDQMTKAMVIDADTQKTSGSNDGLVFSACIGRLR